MNFTETDIKLSDSRELHALFLSPAFEFLENLLITMHEDDVNSMLAGGFSGNSDFDTQQLNVLKGQQRVLYALDALKTHAAEAVKAADSPIQELLDLHPHPWIADGSGESFKFR